MSDKIIKLSDISDSNVFITPLDMLKDAIEDEEIKAGKYNRAILLLLNDKGENNDKKHHKGIDKR